MGCVQELLEAGASITCGSYSALRRAEAGGHDDVAELLRQHAAKPPATATAPTPNLSGRRVRIGGLQARPELNGRCGVAELFCAAKGRYKVAVEGEAEAVLLKPENLLQDIGRAFAAACPPEQAPAALAGTLNQPVPVPQEVLLGKKEKIPYTQFCADKRAEWKARLTCAMPSCLSLRPAHIPPSPSRVRGTWSALPMTASLLSP